MGKRLKDYTIEDRKARPMCPAKPIDFGDDDYQSHYVRCC